MDLIDTHCHIQSIDHPGNDPTNELWRKSGLSADTVITEAASSDVSKLICVGCDLEDSDLAVSFIQSRANCFASLGIHPHESSRYISEHDIKDRFTELADQPRVVAIGECGLDYFYTHSTPEDQHRLLKWQLELAVDLDLPVIFHVREAFADFWPIFDHYKGQVRGVLHSYTDSIENMELAIKRGLYFGINGISTFAKDPKQQLMFRSIPLEHLLLETDSPYLTPAPYRGTINTPKQIRTIAEFVSNSRGVGLEEVAQSTTLNTESLFNI